MKRTSIATSVLNAYTGTPQKRPVIIRRRLQSSRTALPELEAKIVRHWREHGQPNSAITLFRRTLARATIQLPRGQAGHALRHTFASHFIQNGRNILTLQRILGHSSLVMTVRYAHLALGHLQDAVR
jgi:site-specific recombinase XerD